MSVRPDRSRTLSWLGALAIIVGTGALVASLVVVLFDGDGDGDGDGAQSGTVLNREVTLRSAPDAGAGALATLGDGVPIVITARSADGEWVEIAVEGRGVTGWAPADAVGDPGDATPPAVAPPRARPPATASPAPTATGPTQTPDYPDLTIEAIYSSENRLVVAIMNIGDADVGGAIFVIVDDGEPVQKNVGDKPLRPGDTLEAVLADEYVQRRGAVTVEVRLGEATLESSLDNNRRQLVLSPDVPNDLAVAGVTLDAATQTLTVTVQNNSIIPVVGVANIAVRQTAPLSTLITRFEAQLEVPAGGTQDFVRVLGLDDGELPALADLQVILSPDPINDAVEANNIFPR